MSHDLINFSTDKNSETLINYTINDGQSMFVMSITVLYVVEGLETETLKLHLIIK